MSTFSRFSNYTPKALPTLTATNPADSEAAPVSAASGGGEGARVFEALESTIDTDTHRRKATSDHRRLRRNDSGGSRERQLTYSTGTGPDGGSWSGETLPINAGVAISTDGSSFLPSSGSAFSGISDGDSGWSHQRRFPAPIPEDRNYLSPDSSGENPSAFRGRYGAPRSTSATRRAERSRGMKFNVSATVTGDRGMVALAKPREGEAGRVVIAGRTCEQLLYPAPCAVFETY